MTTLASALKHKTFVTVETVEGDLFIGHLVAVSFEQVQVVSGMQGRPVVLDVEDIEDIRKVDRYNLHVEKTSTGAVGRSVRVKTFGTPRRRKVRQYYNGRKVLRVRKVETVNVGGRQVPITNVGFRPSGTWEWTCRRCNETFLDERDGFKGVRHGETEMGTPCNDLGTPVRSMKFGKVRS